MDFDEKKGFKLLEAVKKVGEATQALATISNTAAKALKQGNDFLKLFSEDELSNKRDFNFSDIKDKQKNIPEDLRSVKAK